MKHSMKYHQSGTGIWIEMKATSLVPSLRFFSNDFVLNETGPYVCS